MTIKINNRAMKGPPQTRETWVVGTLPDSDRLRSISKKGGKGRVLKSKSEFLPLYGKEKRSRIIMEIDPAWKEEKEGKLGGRALLPPLPCFIPRLYHWHWLKPTWVDALLYTFSVDPARRQREGRNRGKKKKKWEKSGRVASFVGDRENSG